MKGERIMQNEWIVISEYCDKCHIEPTFIDMLCESGLIDVEQEGGERYLPFSELPDVERYSRMYYDLSINMEGIDAIHHLLARMEEMQALRKRSVLYTGTMMLMVFLLSGRIVCCSFTVTSSSFQVLQFCLPFSAQFQILCGRFCVPDRIRDPPQGDGPGLPQLMPCVPFVSHALLHPGASALLRGQVPPDIHKGGQHGAVGFAQGLCIMPVHAQKHLVAGFHPVQCFYRIAAVHDALRHLPVLIQ